MSNYTHTEPGELHPGANASRRYALSSMAITTFLYIMLWVAAAHFLNFRQFVANPDKAEKPRDRMSVKTISLADLIREKYRQDETVNRRIPSEQEKELQKLFDDKGLVEKPKLKPKTVIEGLGKELTKPEMIRKSPEMVAATSPLPEILAIKAEDLPSDRLGKDGRLTIPGTQRYLLPSGMIPSIAVDGGSGALAGPYSAGLGIGPMRIGLPTRGTSEFSAPPLSLNIPDVTPAIPTGITTMPEEVGPVGRLEGLLKVKVKVYRDPRTQEGYFKVDITTNEASRRLKAIPKDVLFLIDCSASITTARLVQFRNGVVMALDYLGEQDQFNVVAFREKPMPLFDTFQFPTEANLKNTVSFLEDLRSSGKTDVYAGLSPFIADLNPDSKRPYMIYLITDGKTTTGFEFANNEFIQRISNLNTSRVAICSFSSGEDTNMFLLNFLAYQNRGFCRHESSVKQASGELSEYINGLSEVLVSDMNCQVTGVSEPVYPRELPHLYRDHPLSVTGKFNPDVKEVIIRVRGINREGTPEELLVRQSLEEAEAATSELATEWAAQKIYYLISERTRQNTPEIQEAINRTADKYKIIVPY